MINLKKGRSLTAWVIAAFFAMTSAAFASEIDLKIPSLDVSYNIFGYAITGSQILLYGLGICALGLLFGLCEFVGIKRLPAHQAMLNVSHTIYETCKTYMRQQAKLLVVLEEPKKAMLRGKLSLPAWARGPDGGTALGEVLGRGAGRFLTAPR